MRQSNDLPRVTVYGYGPAYGFPDLSPFVLKVLYYLKTQGYPIATVLASPRQAPRGKLPFIEIDGEKFSDSRHIIQTLEARHTSPLDAWMEPDHRAMARALQSMLEEHLYFITLCGRWVHDEGFEVLRPVLLDYLRATGVPAFLTSVLISLIRKSVIKQAHAQGAGRLTREEQGVIAHEIFAALDQVLGDKPFMLGDKPCTLDCTVGAFTTLGLIEDFQHETASAFRKFPRLIAYAKRSHERYLA